MPINEQKRWHENKAIIPTYKLFSKTTLSSFWEENLKTDVYNQFLNRMTGNTKIVQWKTFIPTNIPVFKYDKWKPILISESLILFKLLWKNKFKIMGLLSSYLPLLNFKFSEQTFYILWNKRKCVVRIEAEVSTVLTKVIWRNWPLSVNKWFYTRPLLQASTRHWW